MTDVIDLHQPDNSANETETVEPTHNCIAASDDPRLVFSTIKKIQARYDVSHVTVWSWINSGRSKTETFGKRTIRISRQAELDFIASSKGLFDIQAP